MSTLFAYRNMIRYDPTLVDLTSNFLILFSNVKVCLYNYSWWVELGMNIHEGKGYNQFVFPSIADVFDWLRYQQAVQHHHR